MMKAVVLPDFDSAPELRRIPVPEPVEGEVRVRVHAASINGFDVSVAAGRAKGMMEHRFPVVLGKDFAGTVESVGAGVAAFSAGDRVFGVVTKPYLGDGSLGEFVTVPVAVGIARLPDTISFETGGALGLAGTTARLAVDAAELSAGQTVLIAGATGGVGTIAVQLAAQAGARVIATAHGDEERRLVSDLGAAEVVDYREDLRAQIRAVHPEGIDTVLHFAGDPGAVLPLVRAGGRLASTLIMSADQIPSGTVTVKAIYAVPAAELLDGLADAVASASLTIPVQRAYALEEVPAALRDFARGVLGKLAITVR
ncbi:NADP-dependent oxidoreductase [Longimicrobium terrae]|uniref:NADPH:quinone reductase-like Zn-dependent oxidoreductase n=1 Tax=Longimicrobium terrae TaxID=1639882 RepID=A0A841GRZ8_9BACT|nr:NADP-dependent oxidoreductase [Longimicrobium terrae]MBB4636036.1 NADPH:quinone reductase-like Zn-dependent oxidoreductase [Longimicrobium terrae]MBB6070432.1 NADPH:quinone reductase-like Zn-dependent oxidoreductase [Longimicrobium terrae]